MDTNKEYSALTIEIIDTPWKYIIVPMWNVLEGKYDNYGFPCGLSWKEEFLEWCVVNGLITAAEPMSMSMSMFAAGAFNCVKVDNGIEMSCFAFGHHLRYDNDLHVLFKATWG